MRIEIDQSGKIEQTNKPTVIGFANGTSFAILLPAVEKQKLQKYFRNIGKARAFVYQVFNAMIYLSIKDYIKNIDKIIIDREYPGQETEIRDQIYALLLKNHHKNNHPIIQFKEIGKLSKAHNLVWEAYRSKKVGLKITAKDILAVFLG